LATDQAIIISGELDGKAEKPSVIVSGLAIVRPFTTHEDGTTFIPEDKHTAVIQIPRNTPKEVLSALGTLLKSNPGDVKVKIVIPNGGNSPKVMELPYKINYSDSVKKEVNKLLK
jgi:hypothetical protein